MDRAIPRAPFRMPPIRRRLARLAIATAALLALAGAARADTLVKYGSGGWSYLVEAHGGLQGFQAPSFDAAAAGFKPSGRGPFSSGGGCGYTSRTKWPVNTDLLVRRLVAIPSRDLPPAQRTIEVALAIDNDDTVYWNGTEIGSNTHDGCASANSYVYQVPANLVSAGENLLAIRASDRGGVSYFDAAVLATATTPTVTTTSLPDGVAQHAYSLTLQATGGVTPYKWTLATGKLPTGLRLNKSTGAISGTPTVSGSFPLVVDLTDHTKAVASAPLSLFVAGPTITGINPTSGPNTGGSIMVKGHGFTTSSVVTLTASGLTTHTLATTYNSSEELVASPALPARYAGEGVIAVTDPTAPSIQKTAPKFTMFVPMIGKLVAKKPLLGPTQFDECTAAVIDSGSGDLVLSAGHCVQEALERHTEFAFAPGWTGTLCAPKHGHPLFTKSRELLECGHHPYEIWESNAAFIPPQWGLDELDAYDFSYLAMEKQAGKPIEQRVGGFPASFEWEGPEPTSYNPLPFDAFGEPGGPTKHCFGVAGALEGTSGFPPDDVLMSKCALGSGASGGPWLFVERGGQDESEIGAVNSKENGDLAGTYLGRAAREWFIKAEQEDPYK